jgi:hypothetical protein
VLMPVHATRLEVYCLGGFMPLIESWKQTLAHSLAAAAQLPGSGTIRAFDFSPITPLSLEDFPPPGSGKRTRFFLETLHPGPLVGDMIVARLLSRVPPVKMPGFGVPLEEAVAPGQIAEERARLRMWEESHPDLVREIKALVAQEAVTTK